MALGHQARTSTGLTNRPGSRRGRCPSQRVETYLKVSNSLSSILLGTNNSANNECCKEYRPSNQACPALSPGQRLRNNWTLSRAPHPTFQVFSLWLIKPGALRLHRWNSAVEMNLRHGQIAVMDKEQNQCLRPVPLTKSVPALAKPHKARL
ncbi:hypothetical protein PGT21_005273 [Puccinia graminis f. sp. tritici]|uniref:Uncharacterized protein n=1 Tax=Puccinia graminis f. sp. tritici TaxID=56615 RepID=A0A5B0PI89_PUCGR|nr:hypothetical protein PGTUg99_012346 [Puccinia graminis f. sp. tritici]KAA1109976.1 hypothetical protein PGT21_005273 [Puccinia graminis f. sp. tritici]